MKHKEVELYFAGALFNAGQRVNNILLKSVLEEKGYCNIKLPQKEAVKFRDPNTGKFDTKKIVEDCLDSCCSTEIVMVICIDDSDADSGTCFEYGANVGYAKAKGVKLKIVVYRTDFRTDIKTECGVNAMLLPEGVSFIYEPCFIVEDVKEIFDYYQKLGSRIDSGIQKVLSD